MTYKSQALKKEAQASSDLQNKSDVNRTTRKMITAGPLWPFDSVRPINNNRFDIPRSLTN